MRGAEYYRAVWGDSYDKIARYYDFGVRAFGLVVGGERRIRKLCVELTGLKKGDSVLDLCCGTGSLLVEALTHNGGEGRFVGIDLSRGMLEVARRKRPAQGALFTLADAETLPLQAEQFDVVTLTLALHEMPAEVRAGVLSEANRVLRPKGRLLVVEMSRPPKGLSRFLSEKATKALSTVHEKKTLEELLQKGVEREIKTAGFSVTRREKFLMGFFEMLAAMKD